jgi:hypothetical protein
MSYSFDTQINKWDTLPDVFDSYLEELNALESMDKEDREVLLSLPAFDIDEVL